MSKELKILQYTLQCCQVLSCCKPVAGRSGEVLADEGPGLCLPNSENRRNPKALKAQGSRLKAPEPFWDTPPR